MKNVSQQIVTVCLSKGKGECKTAVGPGDFAENLTTQGVFAMVLNGGPVKTGDSLEILAPVGRQESS